jgi:hypothetical protein
MSYTITKEKEFLKIYDEENFGFTVNFNTCTVTHNYQLNLLTTIYQSYYNAWRTCQLENALLESGYSSIAPFLFQDVKPISIELRNSLKAVEIIKSVGDRFFYNESSLIKIANNETLYREWYTNPQGCNLTDYIEFTKLSKKCNIDLWVLNYVDLYQFRDEEDKPLQDKEKLHKMLTWLGAKLKNFPELHKLTNHGNFIYLLQSFYRDCYDLDVKADIKLGTLRTIYEISLTAYRQKQKEKEEQFQESLKQAKIFEFSNNNYEVSLPTCVDDLTKMGLYFHNCVGGYADSIINKECVVVFVKNKTTQTFEACVSVDMNGQYIDYFLGRYNDKIRDEELIDFREIYEKYVDHIFQKGNAGQF